jgi:hypothetical protein
MKLGNFEFAEVIGRDDGKTYVLRYVSPDKTFQIEPVVSILKNTLMPQYLRLYLQQGGDYVLNTTMALPPNNQQDLDNWNMLTKQGLTFEDLPNRDGTVREIVNLSDEVLQRLDEIRTLLKAMQNK